MRTNEDSDLADSIRILPTGQYPAAPYSPVPWRFAILLILSAFVLRLGTVMALRDIRQFHGPGPAGADAVEFNALALNIAAGHGYEILAGHPTAFRAPGFPLLLASIYVFAPANYVLSYLLFCVIGAATCVLTWLTARELIGERAARAAGILLAIYFPHIYQSSLFLSEGLFGLCTTGALWLCLLYIRKGDLRFLAGSGLLFGYAALTRPVALVMAAFLVLALFRSSGYRVRRKFITRAVCFGVAVAAVVLPWTYRNFRVFHKNVLIATNGGSTFYGSNNDKVLHDPRYMGFWLSTVSLPGRNLIDATPDEVAHDQMEWSLGEKWVGEHWQDMPILAVYKLVRFVLPAVASQNKTFVVVQTFCYLPFLALIVIGLARAGRPMWHEPGWFVLHCMVAANLLNVLVFCGDPRYRDAIAPILIIYAATGLGILAGWFRVPSPGSERLAPQSLY